MSIHCGKAVDILRKAGEHPILSQQSSPVDVDIATRAPDGSETMRNGNKVFGPDELKVLSQIVTVASQQLHALPLYQALDRNVLREKVAKQAIAYAGTDLLEPRHPEKIVAAWSNRRGDA